MASISASLRLFSSLSASAETAEGLRHLGKGKPVALLAYLSAAPGRRASRERLATLLWAEGSSEQARQNLRQTIWYIRRRLGPWLITSEDFVELSADVESDRLKFLAAVRDQRYRDALASYTGEFIPDFAAPGAAEFEQWADVERRRLRALFTGCCDTLARQLLAEGQAQRAAEVARRARDEAPLEFATWRLLFESLIAARDPVGSLAEAEHLDGVLAANEMELDEATRIALRAARQYAATSAKSEDPAPAAGGTSADAPTGAVAVDDARTFAPELIGREAEFRTLLARWEETRRGRGGAILISGVAGLGKSRLLADLHARLRAGRARAVLLRANPGDRAVGSGFIAAVAESIAQRPGAAAISADSASVLVALAPALSSSFPQARPDAATGEDALRRRVGALLDLLRAVSEESALALFVDDVHWTDPDSRRVLDAIAARLEGGRVLLVITSRPPLDALAGFVALPRIELPRFDLARTAEFVSRLGDLPAQEWSAEFPAQLLAATRGIPLTMIEALQRLVETGALRLEEGRWVAESPAQVAELLRDGMVLEARVRTLAPGARELLVLLATLGRPVPLASLAPAGHGFDRGAESAAPLQPILAELEHRGFVARHDALLHVSHDEIAAAALAAATDDERRRGHARAASLLATERESDASLLLAASHAAAAEDSPLLRALAQRYVERRRRDGDGRSVREILGSLVGTPPEGTALDALAKVVPWYRRPSRAVRRSVAALLVLSLTLAGWRVTHPERAPDLEFYLVTNEETPRLVQFRLADAERWDAGEPWEGRAVPFTAFPTAFDAARRIFYRSLPDGSGWVGAGFFAEGGGDEMTLLSATGALSRPVSYAGDDWIGSPSPDGAMLVFPTARFHPATDRSNLAIYDRRTGEVRRLLESSETDATPYWSPDGTRIAFYRNYFSAVRPTTVCVVAVDGRDPRCDWPALTEGVVTLGWLDPEHVLLRSASLRLISLDVTTGIVSDASESSEAPLLLEDGRTIISATEASERAPSALIAQRVDRRGSARALRVGGAPVNGRVVLSTYRRHSNKYAEHARLDLPDGGIPVDAPFTLRASALAADGSTVRAHAVRIRSLDDSVATVVNSVLRPRRAGVARLEVSLGGWRTDTVAARVVPATAVTLLSERWGADWSERWRGYGDPKPRLARGDGGPTLVTNGDGKYGSGAYLMRELDAATGLGVELRVSAPLTARQWQDLIISLHANTTFRAQAAWDHLTGNLREVHDVACQTTLGGEGGAAHAELIVNTAAGGVAGRAPTPARLYDGSWHTVRLQLFADGRCGLAVDGVPLIVTAKPVTVRSPILLDLQGASVGTTIQVGRTEVWTGVRGGVDWESVRR